MNSKKILGWLVILVVSLLPVLALFMLRPEIDAPLSYTNLTHTIGQLAGLIGMTIFALTFVFSTRLKFIEDTFGGLDKVYRVHAALGGTALVLLLLHPLFLVLKYIPSNIGLAAKYLLPGGHASVDYGIIALAGMIILLFITLYVKIKYNYWKMSHKFLSLFFIFAILHIFLIRETVARDYIFKGYFIYAIIVSAIGLAALTYTLTFKESKRYLYSVESIIKPRQEVYDIRLKPVYKSIKFKPGQFAFLRFISKNLSKEAHPFSFASSPKDKGIRFVIKADGDFTSTLDNLKVGDKVWVEGPYGRFYPKTNSDQIWLAAGIGITPFISMAQEIKEQNGTVLLFYTSRNKDDFISLDVFKQAEKTNKLRLITWVTSERPRLTVDDIIKESKSLKNKEFFLCGPQVFKESLTKNLIKKGVPDNKIHEEEFTFK